MSKNYWGRKEKEKKIERKEGCLEYLCDD